MQARAARIWEVQAEDVELRDGVFTCTQHPEARMTFKELARQLNRTGGPITCSMSTNSTGVDMEQDGTTGARSEEHTSELQSQSNLVCRLLLEKKKKKQQEVKVHQKVRK